MFSHFFIEYLTMEGSSFNLAPSETFINDSSDRLDNFYKITYDGVSVSFRTSRLERELQMVDSLPLDAVVSLFCKSV
jgi:hypothetical protein